MSSMCSEVEDGSLEPGTHSSAGEHALHTGGVVGSIPTASTTSPRRFVYVIQSRTLRLVKIGLAGNPRARLRGLQTGSPDKLELLGAFVFTLAADLEAGFHKKFVQHHAHGEWYHPNGEVGLVADRFRRGVVAPEYGFPVIDMDAD